MVIWSGFGFLVGIAGIAGFVVVEFLLAKITGDANSYRQHWWGITLGGMAAAMFTYTLNQLFSSQKARTVIDKETGEEIELRPGHSLFFIPARFWPVIFLVIGIAMGISNLLKK